MAAALFSAVACLAGTYQVYDFTMTVKTTKGKGAVETSCGDTYVWRDSGTQKIQGIVAGCGCGAVNADGVCENALVLLWNTTTKTQITNIEMTTWIVQRIGKSGEKVEHIAQITSDDFTVMLAGLGAYKTDKRDANLDCVKNVSGNFAGYAVAPYFLTKGYTSCCAPAVPDSEDQTMAVSVCNEGVCTAATNGDVTPFYGTYSLKYNSTKSSNCSKKGISSTTLKTPAYVDISKGTFD